MKKKILIMLVAVAVMACKTDSKNKVEATDAKKVEATDAETASYVVITDKSILTWKGFKPTGTHNGTIAISKGKLDVSGGDDLVGGKFIIDMNSIKCLDLPREGKYSALDLEGHLKSDEFFDVEKFPTATFEITKVEKNDAKVNVTGNLTVKGITKSITIPATFGVANGFATFKSDLFKIDRTEFGIEYKSTKLADVIKEKSIDDLFEMSFDVMAKK